MGDSGAGTGEGAVEAVRWRIARWRQERERLGPMPEERKSSPYPVCPSRA
ncbi:MAG: hypothetical protein AMXMBFR64_50290 [Myxococcales bacterium]